MRRLDYTSYYTFQEPLGYDPVHTMYSFFVAAKMKFM
jgi:hypothetical protein